MKPTPRQLEVLKRMAAGEILVDTYRPMLRSQNGNVCAIDSRVFSALREKGYIDRKAPCDRMNYVLTDKGRAAIIGRGSADLCGAFPEADR